MKGTNLKRITVKKSESLFHNESPNLKILKVKFSTVALSVKSYWSESILSLFLKSDRSDSLQSRKCERAKSHPCRLVVIVFESIFESLPPPPTPKKC